MSLVNSLFSSIQIPATLHPTSILALNEQLDLAEKTAVRFVVLKGAESVFCNGLDLKWVANHPSGNYLNDMAPYAAFLKKLQTQKFITIACVQGAASGGGMGIVCAADFVIATENSFFSLPEGLLGLIPGMILPSLLNRLTPHQIKQMVFSGKKYSASEMRNWNLIDTQVSTEMELENELKNVMNTFRSCKMEAVKAMKEMLYDTAKDELSLKGMQALNNTLQQPEMIEKLRDLTEFIED